MRYYTALLNGKETVMLSADGGKTLYSAAALGFPFQDMNELILADCAEQMKAAVLAANPKDGAPAESVTLLAPIPRPRQDVVCLGINYFAHAVEADKFSSEAFGGERPYTIYFSKRVSRAGDPNGIIPAYTGLVDSLDYEAELGVVLGKDTKGASKENALDNVFGYTVINDVSARNLQTRHKQWLLGKSLDGFTPMGPCIVSPDELGDHAKKDIRCYVNGELRQNSNTSLMIQTVPGAIAELSQGMTLQAGTIIAMGTPAGVGMGMDPPTFLKPGDVVRCEIEDIGVLESTVE